VPWRGSYHAVTTLRRAIRLFPGCLAGLSGAARGAARRTNTTNRRPRLTISAPITIRRSSLGVSGVRTAARDRPLCAPTSMDLPVEDEVRLALFLTSGGTVETSMDAMVVPFELAGAIDHDPLGGAFGLAIGGR